MFALALYDRVRHSVLLARDPLGIKPLYWLRHRNGLVFSSQYDAVVRHPWCERQRLRPDVAALYLRLGYVPSPHGIVEDTGQVAAGTRLTWSAEAGPVVHEYAPWPDPPSHYLSASDEAEVVHAAAQASVRRQLVADVPVGTFLSGGVDSPLVTALSRAETGRPLPAFTIGSEHEAFDERAQARRYAEHLDVAHTVRTITEADALALVDDVLDAFGEPFGDYSAFPTMLVSRIAREQVTVVLSGDGADELFFGYPRTWTTLRWRGLFRLPPLARRVLRKALSPWPDRRPPESATFPTLGAMYATPHEEFTGRSLSAIAPGLGVPPAAFDLYDLAGVPTADELAQWLRRTEVRGHLEKMLIKVDRASMHESLEVRVPLLDDAMVTAALQVDPSRCMVDGLGKVPLRRELARHIPPALITRPKQGFGVPLGDWLKGPLGDRFRTRVLDAPVVLADAFDRPTIDALYRSHCAGSDRTQPLWNLLTLQEWAARHLRPVST
jgi:asparagine synthase (glutamine-hydrolysing)